jgi:hypothetical protein
MRWAKAIHHLFSLCSHLDATLRLHGAEEEVPLCLMEEIQVTEESHVTLEEILSTFLSAQPTLYRSVLADPA